MSDDCRHLRAVTVHYTAVSGVGLNVCSICEDCGADLGEADCDCGSCQFDRRLDAAYEASLRAHNLANEFGRQL